MSQPKPQPLTVDGVKAGPLPMNGFAIIGGQWLAYLVKGVAESGKLQVEWHDHTVNGWVPMELPADRLFPRSADAWLNEALECEGLVERLTENISMLELQLSTAEERLAHARKEFRRLTGKELP